MVKRVCVTEWVEPCGDIVLKAKGIYYPFFKATIEGYESVPGMFNTCLKDVAEGKLFGKIRKKSLLADGTRFTGKKYYVTVGEQHA